MIQYLNSLGSLRGYCIFDSLCQYDALKSARLVIASSGEVCEKMDFDESMCDSIKTPNHPNEACLKKKTTTATPSSDGLLVSYRVESKSRLHFCNERIVSSTFMID